MPAVTPKFGVETLLLSDCRPAPTSHTFSLVAPKRLPVGSGQPVSRPVPGLVRSSTLEGKSRKRQPAVSARRPAPHRYSWITTTVSKAKQGRAMPRRSAASTARKGKVTYSTAVRWMPNLVESGRHLGPGQGWGATAAITNHGQAVFPSWLPG